VTLISCPECDKPVSDYAKACPNCGFPVAEEIKQTVAEITGTTDSPKTARGQAAAHKLAIWANKYHDHHRGERLTKEEGGESFLARHKNWVIVVVVAVILALQLVLLFSAVY
jgi:hypothetical protein